MDDFPDRRALGTMRTTIDRTLERRFLTSPNAVLNFGMDGAADRTMRADVLLEDDRNPELGRADCLSFFIVAALMVPTAASAPAVRPERRRKVRRSTPTG